MAEPVRTKRTVVKGTSDTFANYPDPNNLGAYTPPLQATGREPKIVPIYDAFNPLQAEMETNPMNRARSTLDAERFWIGITTYRLQGNFYVYGTGQPTDGYLGTGGDVVTDDFAGAFEELPPWARAFLPGAGFTPSYTATQEYVTFNPVSEAFEWAYLEVYLNKYLHKMYGARGNLVFSAVAANPVQVAFDFTGLYQAATLASNPSDTGTDPGLPPRLCSAQTLYICPEDTSISAIVPNLKSFSLNLGVTTQQRRNANKENCLEEIGIYSEFNPHLTVTFEVEDFDAKLGTIHGVDPKDFIEAARQGMGFNFELNIGPYTDGTAQGERWQFRNYHAAANSAPNTAGTTAMIEAATRFPMTMATAPQYVDVDGIRCYECDFLLGGNNNNFLQIIGM